MFGWFGSIARRSPFARPSSLPPILNGMSVSSQVVPRSFERTSTDSDAANKVPATSLIAERLNVPPDIASEILAVATDPVSGLAGDAAFDLEGLKTVLRLRTAFEDGNASPAEKYFDLTWHKRALASL